MNFEIVPSDNSSANPATSRRSTVHCPLATVHCPLSYCPLSSSEKTVFRSFFTFLDNIKYCSSHTKYQTSLKKFFRGTQSLISRVQLTRGGFTCCSDFFRLFFFLKMRFLSDYKVPGGPKNTPGQLRSFSKKSAKKFSFFFFFQKVGGFLEMSFMQKIAFWGGLKTPKMAIESKNAIFSKSEIMIPQSNLGKRKVKLILVRP